MPTADELSTSLRSIEGRGYKAYREVLRDKRFDFPDFTLFVDHVQADPFAAPSKLRVRFPAQVAQIPTALFDTPTRRIALVDFLAREVRRRIREVAGPAPSRADSGRSGLIHIDAGGQEVIERNCVLITPEWVEARITLGLPASGRRVQGHKAARMLCEMLPLMTAPALCYSELPQREMQDFIDCVENQEHLRAQLSSKGLVAFVMNGSSLPRESGASDLPMRGEEVVRFESPPSLEVELELLNQREPTDDGRGSPGSVFGMGIPKGVTLIVGGGYHGKSTLLHSLERGIHPHIPGDGREGVVSERNLVKVRAEDGRYVTGVDISCFIASLPRARDTKIFSSEDASGSTSQAANIAEALEVGASGLLLDEDTSASNFMLRDARMQALVATSHEPITPFLDRVRELYDVHGVSTVLVMGGCGDYFDVADRVIMLRDYAALDAAEEARTITVEHPSSRTSEARAPMRKIAARTPDPRSFDASSGRREVKLASRGVEQLRYGDHDVDLRSVEQLLDPSQTRAIGQAIFLAATRFMGPDRSLAEVRSTKSTRCSTPRGWTLSTPSIGAVRAPRRWRVRAASRSLQRSIECEASRCPAATRKRGRLAFGRCAVAATFQLSGTQLLRRRIVRPITRRHHTG